MANPAKKVAKGLTREENLMLSSVTGTVSMIRKYGGVFEDYKTYMDELFNYAMSTIEYESEHRKRPTEDTGAYISVLAKIALQDELRRVLRNRVKGDPKYVIHSFKRGRLLNDIIRYEHGIASKAQIKKERESAFLLDSSGKEKDISTLVSDLPKAYRADYRTNEREVISTVFDHACRMADYHGIKVKLARDTQIKLEMKKLAIELHYELSFARRHFKQDLVIEYKIGRDEKSEQPTFIWNVMPTSRRVPSLNQ
ncbi:MAG: hypothetical protein WCK90_01440 [archaeon]